MAAAQNNPSKLPSGVVGFVAGGPTLLERRLRQGLHISLNRLDRKKRRSGRGRKKARYRHSRPVRFPP